MDAPGFSKLTQAVTKLAIAVTIIPGMTFASTLAHAATTGEASATTAVAAVSADAMAIHRVDGLIVKLRKPAASIKASDGDVTPRLRDAQSGLDAVHSPRLQALGMSPTLGTALASVAARLGRIAGTFRPRRALTSDTLLIDIEGSTSLDAARSIAARIAADPDVQYAVPDVRVHPAVPIQSPPASSPPASSPPAITPAADSSAPMSLALALHDPQALAQWPLFRGDDAGLLARGGNAGGAGFTALWPQSRGAGVTVAVIDTGITAHADLDTVGIQGYDFIGADADGSLYTANDGDGRDADPSDPGNDCDRDGQVATSSTWHGTQVAGLLAAHVGNDFGIAGAAPLTRVLSLRVMGRCGGRSSDVVDAIRWAAGLTVPNVPDNPTPARIINLSLSTAWNYRCDAAMQDAVDAATAAGSLIVAAAGNDAAALDYPAQGGVSAPANCVGVVAVGAHTRSGDRALYANHGPAIALTAPGGGACAAQRATACLPDTLATTTNAGLSAPAADSFQFGFIGTSAATPHVAAAAALLWSMRPDLKPAQVASVLTSGARAWPVDSWCAAPEANGHCGAGMLDVEASAARLHWPLVTIEPTRTIVAGGSHVPIRAAVESQEYSPQQMRYEWFIGSSALAANGELIPTASAADAGGARRTASLTTASGASEQVTLADAASATPTLIAPGIRSDVSLAVRITDPLGRVGWATTRVAVDNAPVFDPQEDVHIATGRKLDLQLKAVDPDGDTVRYGLVDAPAGVILDSATGRVSWDAPAQGSHTIRVGAQDDFGASAQPLDVEVRVDDAAGSDASRGPGGGGEIDGRSLLLFAALAIIALALRRRGRCRG